MPQLSTQPNAPSVLVLAGLDPCGGAGIVADIETLNQFGVVPLPIITTLTVQNTQSVARLSAVSSALIAEQLAHLMADIEIRVVKIGLLSDAQQIQTIAQFLAEHSPLKIILDPIIRATAGRQLLHTQALDAFHKNLLPLITILTPNVAELQALAPEMSERQALKSLPCEWVLLTTTDVSEVNIKHRLYHRGALVKCFEYEKLAGNYHGSGCTLSSAISGLVARGATVEQACSRALDYTYQALLNAKRVGKMQFHPNRQTPNYELY